MCWKHLQDIQTHIHIHILGPFQETVAAARGAFACCQGDMAGKAEALSLYRRIMRTAQCWPSIKKEAVKTEIRDEFRRNMGEANPQKMAKMLDEARSGLQSLRQQCGMSSEGSDINYMYDDALQRRYKPPSR